ncbi:MAG TPA: histone deacetylase [Terriglobales bacterium]|nr:histone deacetylase [Terriglobales bacterium]
MKTLFYTDHYVMSLPEGHRFPIAKYRLTRDLLAQLGYFRFEVAPLADREVIELAHDREYVEAFLAGTLPAQAMRRIGFPWSEGLVKRTLASVGATLAATREAMVSGWGGTLAGGTHHAFRAEGSGYCVFNDIAVAIQWLRQTGQVKRAAVVDLDVHQGDGTAQIFQDDPDVLTLSVHCQVNFPFRKQQSKIDVSLAEGIGDEEYLRALQKVLPRVFEFAPEIVFYQAGADPLNSDALGKLKLTHEGLITRDRMVMTQVRAAGLPFVVTMGGGYSKPIELTAQAHANTFRTAAEVFGNAFRQETA